MEADAGEENRNKRLEPSVIFVSFRFPFTVSVSAASNKEYLSAQMLHVMIIMMVEEAERREEKSSW